MTLLTCSSPVKFRRDTLIAMILVFLSGIMINTTSSAHCGTTPVYVGSLPAIELPAFNIETLIDRLKKTKAIGLFTKLALKGDVDDLLGDIQKVGTTNKLDNIRSQFDGLVLKTLTLLDDKDPTLAEDIYISREQIWQSIIEDKT